MNIGNGIFLMLLLVSGVFATSAVLPESASLATNEVVDASEVVVGSIGTDDINSVLIETGESMSPNLKRVGFANTWRGHGWIENGESGYHITGFWAVQKFAALDADMASVENTRTGRTLGRLHVAGAGNYKLVRYNDDLTSEDSVDFQVISLNDKYPPYSDAEDAVEGATSASGEMLAGEVVGKFTLTKKASYVGLTTWKGLLVLDSGDLSGEWDVEFATTLKRVRQNVPGPVVKGVQEIRAARSEVLAKAGVNTIAELTDEQKAELKNDVLDGAGVDTIAELTDEQKAEIKNLIEEKRKSFWGRVAFWKRG
ncbi:hypothetical protein K8R30_00725 [archaeon]|nr:hypothetical protein [archaeon]